MTTFTKGLGPHLISRGIRVNAIAPGPVWTPLIQQSYPPEQVLFLCASATSVADETLSLQKDGRQCKWPVRIAVTTLSSQKDDTESRLPFPMYPSTVLCVLGCQQEHIEFSSMAFALHFQLQQAAEMSCCISACKCCLDSQPTALPIAVRCLIMAYCMKHTNFLYILIAQAESFLQNALRMSEQLLHCAGGRVWKGHTNWAARATKRVWPCCCFSSHRGRLQLYGGSHCWSDRGWTHQLTEHWDTCILSLRCSVHMHVACRQLNL